METTLEMMWKVAESISGLGSINEFIIAPRVVENVTRVSIISERMPVSRFVQGIVLQSSTCR